MEIRENLLFGGISQENIDKILVCSKSNIKRYAQGEKVFFQGDRTPQAFRSFKGQSQICKKSLFRQETIFRRGLRRWNIR